MAGYSAPNIFIYGKGTLTAKHSEVNALPVALCRFMTSQSSETIDNLHLSMLKHLKVSRRKLLGERTLISEKEFADTLRNYYKDGIAKTSNPLSSGIGSFFIFGFQGTVYLNGASGDLPLLSTKPASSNGLSTILSALNNSSLSVDLESFNEKALEVVKRFRS